MLLNHLCCLTSLAPELDPSRRCSSLINSLRMADLQKLTGELGPQMSPTKKLVAHLVTGAESGKVTSFLSTLAKVAFRFGPLNGVVAN